MPTTKAKLLKIQCFNTYLFSKVIQVSLDKEKHVTKS